MRIGLRETLRKSKLVVLTLTLCSVLLVSAYAIFYLWSASATVTISTSSPYIKVYLHPGGQEVTSIDFGNLVPGSWVYMQLRIKNTHPNATIVGINWDSTLNSVTDKITDSWFHEFTLHPGEVQYTAYQIMVASDCPLGTYSWTLFLYGPL